MPRNKQPKVAFVLSGGASLGAIQVGMLRALYEREITPDLIVGTSAGAFNGAYVASRPQTTATAEPRADLARPASRAGVPGQPGHGPARLPWCPRPPRPRVGAASPDLALRRIRRARGDAHPAARRRGGRGDWPRASSFPRTGTRCDPGQRCRPGCAQARLVAGPRPHGRRRGQQHADLPRGRARGGAHLRAADGPRLLTR
jgi:hypothetical protein